MKIRGAPWLCILAAVIGIPLIGTAQSTPSPSPAPSSSPSPSPEPSPSVVSPLKATGELANEPLVDLAKADPSIFIELRYATVRNITGHPIYPPGTLCMVRKGVAERLKEAQIYLHVQGLSLKIWDAYRPAYAQKILWDLVKNPEVVADPSKGGSLHSWGVAVDATLVDMNGHDVPMPTDFDDFTPAARLRYTGSNPVIANNLHQLKNAMAIAGFYGMRDEWWHYMATNWRSYGAIVTMNTELANRQTPPDNTPEPH